LQLVEEFFGVWAVSLLFFMGKGGGWGAADEKSVGSGGVFGSNSRSPAEEQRDPEQYEEDKEEHLGDHGGGAAMTPKPRTPAIRAMIKKVMA